MNRFYPRFEHSTWHLGDFTVVLLLVVFGAYLLPPYFAPAKIPGVRYLASMEHLTHEFILMLCQYYLHKKTKTLSLINESGIVTYELMPASLTINQCKRFIENCALCHLIAWSLQMTCYAGRHCDYVTICDRDKAITMTTRPRVGCR